MNRFENITKPLMWFMALLLTAFVAGCGGSSSGSSAPSSAKAITAYSLKWIGGASGTLGATPGTATGTINETLKTIAVSVPFGTDVTNMKATFTSTGASVQVAGVTQASNITVNDFSGSVAYKVTAVDSTWATYTVIVTPITVTSIAVTPTSFSIPASATHQFMATATYSNSTTSDVTTNISTPNATTTWTAVDVAPASGVASVGPANGLATGLAVGTSDITATFGGQSGTAALTVTSATLTSIAVTPASAVVAVGGTQQFVATGTYSDSTNHAVTTTASWTSAASGVASVGPATGLATGLAGGTSDITATLSGLTSTAALTVTGATGSAAVDLKSILTNNFVILATSTITEATPANGAITGNIGLSPATGAGIFVACSEMLSGGKIHEANAGYAVTGFATCAVPTSAVVGQAVLDMGAAYTAASDPATPAATDAAHLNVLGGILPAGTNFPPGTYTWNTPGDVNINGDITLTGGANDVWIFQISGNLTTAAKGTLLLGTKITLVGTAAGTPKASNVFWQVAGASTTLGTYSTFNGNILTAPAGLIAIQTGAVLHGRALSGTSVALDGNTVGP